jgi:hypothetical protein
MGDELQAAGFAEVAVHRIAATRRTHPDREALHTDIRTRTGRSILHELNDSELARLADDKTLPRWLPAGSRRG